MTRPDIPVTIGGDPRGFEAALARVRALSKTTATDVMASFARLKMLAGGPAALATALGITGIMSAARQAASSVAEIGDAAKMAGVSSRAFQEWSYVAEQARIPIEAITDGLKELSLRADEFAVTGKGSAADAFQRLGLSQEDVKKRLSDPSELLLTLIERTRKLGDTAAGIRIFDELLGGTGGERMVSLIDQGEEGIRNQIKAANDFGRVLSDDVIVKAQEIDRQFNAISTTISTNVKGAIVSLVSTLNEFIDGLNELGKQRTSTIESRLADIVKEKNAVNEAITKIQDNRNLTDGKRNFALSSHNIKLGDLDKEETALRKELENRPKPIAITDSNRVASVPPTAKTSSRSKAEKRDDYAAEKQQMQERIDGIEAETAAQAGLNPLIEDYGFAVEKASAKQALLNAAKQAGKDITPQLAAEIENLATAYANSVVAAGQLAEKQDDIRRRAEDMRNFQKDVTRGIVDGFMQGKKAADIFADALSKISDKLLDSAFDSMFSSKTSGGLGFLGGLTKLFFHANGGIAAGGRPQALPLFARGGVSSSAAIFGEAGPEAAVPLPDGRNIPVELRMPNLSGLSGAGASSPQFTFAPVYNVQGYGEDIAALKRQIQADQQNFQARVITSVRIANQQRVKFGKFS